MLRDIEAGRRSGTEDSIAGILSWCEEVARTGRDLPLTEAVARVGECRPRPDVVDLTDSALSLVRDA